MNDRYAPQLRGDAGAYARYLAGMDASMQQKVALTAAHLLCQGKVADMGMGSGTGSHSLAALYPSLQVVGVDVSPEMVSLARQRYDLPNLTFVQGDIATEVFEPGTLDGILDSSVLHHVTSFSGYDRSAAVRALAVQVRALRDHGVLVVRDFLDPGPGEVLLDLPTDDGDDGDDPRTCSSAALLRRFAREFRSLHAQPGFELRTIEADAGDLPPGWARFVLPHTLAVEFVLRKDYRNDWDTEVMEEYTYATQSELEQAYADLGLRVLASTPIRNPWIVRNRFEGKFVLRDRQGNQLETPATNYVIVGEKVPPGAGVRFMSEPSSTSPAFLRLTHYRNRQTGAVMDLVARPHLSIDAIPWFELEGDLFVLARMSYPRPILSVGPSGLDGSRPPHYVTEPLTVIQDDQPVAQTIEDALHERAGIEPETIRSFTPGSHYYPSPGGLREEVRSMFVRIDPVFVQRDVPDRSGFSTSGRIGAIEARQLLRAAAVGGLPDARLELNVYDLLRAHGRSPGPWIGESIELPVCGPVEATSVQAVLQRAPRRTFERVEPTSSRGFLQLSRRRFQERDCGGTVLAERELELVEPRPLSAVTLAVAVLRRDASGVYLGVDDDDLPAAQSIGGNSNLLVTPAWRLPIDASTMRRAGQFVTERLAAEYGLRTLRMWTLGGRYHPSAGATPEVVHPHAVAVEPTGSATRSLLWVRLPDILEHEAALADGHLRIVAHRVAHALAQSG